MPATELAYGATLPTFAVCDVRAIVKWGVTPASIAAICEASDKAAAKASTDIDCSVRHVWYLHSILYAMSGTDIAYRTARAVLT
eukprot:2587909-Rhodomonas_salina.2